MWNFFLVFVEIVVVLCRIWKRWVVVLVLGWCRVCGVRICWLRMVCLFLFDFVILRLLFFCFVVFLELRYILYMESLGDFCFYGVSFVEFCYCFLWRYSEWWRRFLGDFIMLKKRDLLRVKSFGCRMFFVFVYYFWILLILIFKL